MHSQGSVIGRGGFEMAGFGQRLQRFALLRQERSKVFLEYRCVGRSHVLGADVSLAIDQEGNRQTQNSAISRTNVCRSHHHGIIHLKLLHKCVNWSGAVVHGDADDLKSSVAILPLKFNKMWRFLAAGNTPGGPEIEQDHLPTGRGQTHLAAFKKRKSEIRSHAMLQACGIGSRSPRVVIEVETREHGRDCNSHNQPQFSPGCQIYSPFAVG